MVDQSPDDRIRSVAAMIGEQIASVGFRGCAFLNAAAEYPDKQSPVHQAVVVHRAWFLDTMTVLFDQAGAPDPAGAAQHFVMLRDGAMAAGCFSDPQDVTAVLSRGVDRMLRMMRSAPSE